MPITALSIGPLHTLNQNEVYALPARAVYITSSAAVESSLDGTAFTAHSGAITAARFLRSTLAGTTVVLKAV